MIYLRCTRVATASWFIRLILVLAGLDIPVASAVVPVIDVEAIRQLDQIRSHTSDTANSTDLTRRNTDVIRAVLVEKQKLILALNQISLLQQNGKVLVEVAPTDQIVATVREMVATPDRAPTPLRLGEVPDLSAPSSAIQRIREIAGAPQRFAEAVTALGQDLIGWFTGAPGQLSSSPWGVLDFAEEGAGLLDRAGNLVSNVSAIFETIDELVYTGRSFIGTNWSEVDEVVGLFDATIGEDGILPAVQVPVVGRLASTLFDARRGYQRALEIKSQLEGEAREAARSMDRFAVQNQGPTGRFLAGTDAARRAAVSRLGDGLYIRQEDELDAAYYHMVQEGSRAQRLAFRAATSRDRGFIYDPIVGTLDPNDLVAPTNLNNSLSAGAYAAVERFRGTSGSRERNPYASFASDLAAVADEIVALGAAGKPIRVSRELVERASQASPLNLRQFGRLTALANPSADHVFAGLLDRIEERHGTGLRRISNRGTGEAAGIITLTLPSREAVEYEQRIAASNGRIGQNSRMLNICVATINYSQKALEAASRLRAALLGIAGASDESNALEAVPAMIQNCDQTILFLQRQISDYSLEVERLQKERHNELSSRATYVRDSHERLEQSAMQRIHAALLGRYHSSPSNSPGDVAEAADDPSGSATAGGIRKSDSGNPLQDQTGLAP